MSEAVGWIGGVEWGGALWTVDGPGLRGRLIPHAPQLGRMVMALSCPRSTRHAPTPRWGAAVGVMPLRTGDTVCPHAPRLW